MTELVASEERQVLESELARHRIALEVARRGLADARDAGFSRAAKFIAEVNALLQSSGLDDPPIAQMRLFSHTSTLNTGAPTSHSACPPLGLWRWRYLYWELAVLPRSIFLFVASILFAGCATITKGSMQSVSVNTPNVVGAVCTLSSSSIGSRTITAPATISLEKGSDNVIVRCRKECYEDGEGVIATSIEAMTAGNILVGGVVGVGVDAISGAINKYEPETTVEMRPIKGCKPRTAAL